jgi:hypothetical protein
MDEERIEEQNAQAAGDAKPEGTAAEPDSEAPSVNEGQASAEESAQGEASEASA